MRKVTLQTLFLVAPVAVAAWAAGCSSDDVADAPAADGGVESAPSDPPRSDGATTDAASLLDCGTDQAADGVPRHLACSGLYADFATKTIAPDARPYTPGVTMWNDGASSARFLFLPAGARIDISSFDEWVFPVGTKAWQELTLEGKRIETRFFAKAVNGWHHTTYRWNDAETDAIRTDAGESVKTADGGADYVVPNTGQCDACHGGKADQLLGIEAVSLGLAAATGTTLVTLAADARFDRAPPTTTLTIPAASAGTAAPALGWLHANCGACHADNGISGTTLILRLRAAELVDDGGAPIATNLDAWKTSVNVASMDPDAGAGTYRRIYGGAPAKSLASILSGRRVPYNVEPTPDVQMPPLVTRRVDSAGHRLLDDWIAKLPP